VVTLAACAQQGQVDSWIDFAAHEVELPATLWVYPVVGYLPHNPAVTDKAKADLANALHVSEGRRRLDVLSPVVAHA
jgi:hypothetical protein